MLTWTSSDGWTGGERKQIATIFWNDNVLFCFIANCEYQVFMAVLIAECAKARRKEIFVAAIEQKTCVES